MNYTLQSSGVQDLGLEGGWGKALEGVLGGGEREGGGGEWGGYKGRRKGVQCTDRLDKQHRLLHGRLVPTPTPGSFFQNCTGLILGPFHSVAFPQKTPSLFTTFPGWDRLCGQSVARVDKAVVHEVLIEDLVPRLHAPPRHGKHSSCGHVPCPPGQISLHPAARRRGKVVVNKLYPTCGGRRVRAPEFE